MMHATILPHPPAHMNETNSRGPTAPAIGAFLLAAILVLSGCGTKSAAQPDTASAKPARSEVQHGPVRVTAEVQPSKANLSDEPVLTLTIDSEEGVVVQKPPFGSTLGGFTIRGLRKPLPKISNGHEVIQQIYTLEPTEAGRLRIDPISVAFTDRRPNGDGRTHSVETEPLSVEITSIVGDKTPSLGDLRPPADPIGLPSHVALWLCGLVPVALAVAAAAWWLSRRRRREKAVNAVILSPQQLANMELDKLVASGLAERDIKQFYVELTSIVRRYIERTTGVHAPEQTTEEFLREISRTPPSPPAPLRAPTEGWSGEGSLLDECSRLRDFLESADLVKFAAHQPRAEDIDESVRRARLFVAINIGHSERSEESPVGSRRRQDSSLRSE